MKRKGSALCAVIGAMVVALGLFLMARMDAALPGVLIGVGSGALGMGLSGVFSALVAKKHPDVARQAAIEEQDERNIAVNNRAKARAYDMMVYVFGALMVAFALMNADLAVILMLVGAYLLVVACCVGFTVHYHKTM
ncbi:MAG: hypothetical protein J1E43_09545 [Christensenellaceae bacterium]|nr:hypothetical protein [Christensenellaceae bacterium]